MGFGFKLTRTSIAEYYTAPNGDHCSILIDPDGKATLMLCHPVNNKMYFRKTYNTRRGAKNAMTRRHGVCRFDSMTETYRKEDVDIGGIIQKG